MTDDPIKDKRPFTINWWPVIGIAVVLMSAALAVFGAVVVVFGLITVWGFL